MKLIGAAHKQQQLHSFTLNSLHLHDVPEWPMHVLCSIVVFMPKKVTTLPYHTLDGYSEYVTWGKKRIGHCVQKCV
jgi:hypothetical protein